MDGFPTFRGFADYIFTLQKLLEHSFAFRMPLITALLDIPVAF